MAEEIIDTGDSVFHVPSGETWVVAYVQSGRVCCCGWPCSLAKIEDCQMVEKATPEARDSLLKQMAESSGGDYGSDPRRSYARRKLGLE